MLWVVLIFGVILFGMAIKENIDKKSSIEKEKRERAQAQEHNITKLMNNPVAEKVMGAVTELLRDAIKQNVQATYIYINIVHDAVSWGVSLNNPEKYTYMDTGYDKCDAAFGFLHNNYCGQERFNDNGYECLNADTHLAFNLAMSRLLNQMVIDEQAKATEHRLAVRAYSEGYGTNADNTCHVISVESLTPPKSEFKPLV